MLSGFNLTILLLIRAGLDAIVVAEEVVFVDHILEVFLDLFQVDVVVLRSELLDVLKISLDIVLQNLDFGVAVLIVLPLARGPCRFLVSLVLIEKRPLRFLRQYSLRHAHAVTVFQLLGSTWRLRTSLDSF